MKAGSEIPSQDSDVTNSKASSRDARTTEHAADAAHSAVDRVAGGAAKAEERIREVAATSGERLKEKGAEARISTERAMDHVRQYTKDNPLAAAGIAFAAGLVLSRLVGR